jgi:hypothetical protein
LTLCSIQIMNLLNEEKRRINKWKYWHGSGWFCVSCYKKKKKNTLFSLFDGGGRCSFVDHS